MQSIEYYTSTPYNYTCRINIIIGTATVPVRTGSIENLDIVQLAPETGDTHEKNLKQSSGTYVRRARVSLAYVWKNPKQIDIAVHAEFKMDLLIKTVQLTPDPYYSKSMITHRHRPKST